MILLLTALVVSLQVISGTDEVMASEKKLQDENLYTYCLYRTLVICPNCRLGFEVRDLTEQMNVEWHCECCHNNFVEYATHTV